MAGQNRYLRGETNEAKAPVHGNVAVNPGDFIILGGVTKTFCNSYVSSADLYAYPLSSVTHLSTKSVVGAIRLWFLGVAMNGSPLGVTNFISVAQTGFFRYPLYNPTASVYGTTVGLKISCVTPTGVNSGVSTQHVRMQLHGSTSAYLGYCAQDQAGGASSVIFAVRGKYAPGGVAT